MPRGVSEAVPWPLGAPFSPSGSSLSVSRDLRGRIRESARLSGPLRRLPQFPFEGVLDAFRSAVRGSFFSFARVLEGFSSPVRAIETFTAPAFGGPTAALPLWLSFNKTRNASDRL